MDHIYTSRGSTACSLLILVLAGNLLSASHVAPLRPATSHGENTSIPNPLVAVALSPAKPILEPIQPIDPRDNGTCLDHGRRKLVPTRTMTINLGGVNIVNAEAVVIPYVSLDSDAAAGAASAAATVVIQYYPFIADDPLRGVPTWSTVNVSCASVAPPCAVPWAASNRTADRRQQLRAVVSPSGRELVLLGLRLRGGGQRADAGADAGAGAGADDQAVYVWRDGELFHVAIESDGQQPVLMATALVSMVTKTMTGGEFRVYGLYTPPDDGIPSLWHLDFDRDARSASWHTVFVSSDIQPSDLRCVEMYFDEDANQLIWYGGFPYGRPGCELWLFDLATHRWRHGGLFHFNCTDHGVTTTLATFVRSREQLVVITRDPQETAATPMSYSLYAINPADQVEWMRIRLPAHAGGMQLAALQGYIVTGAEALYLVTDTSPYLYATTRSDDFMDLKNPIDFQAVPQCTSDYGARTTSDPGTLVRLAAPALQYQAPFGTGVAGDPDAHMLLGGEAWHSALAPWSLAVVTRIGDAGPQGMAELSAEAQSVAYTRYVMSWSPVQQDKGLGQGRLYLTMPDPARASGSCRMIVHGGLSVSMLYEAQPLVSIRDLWCLDTCTGKYQAAEFNSLNPQPTGRFNHAGFATGERSFVIFGGSVPSANDSCFVEELSDVWLFTFTNVTGCKGEWRELTPATGSPEMTPLASSSLVQFGAKAVVFGGLVISDNVTMTRNIFEISVDYVSPTYTIRSVASNERLHERAGHTLQKYGSDSLLLIGGSGTYRSANDAQLIYYRIDERERFVITDVVAFFTHRSIVGVAALRLSTGLLLLASAALKNGRSLPAPPIVFLPFGLCPAGFSERDGGGAARRCVLCPRNTWGYDGRRCYACPPATSTPEKGSVTPHDCTPCTLSFCNGHGGCENVDNKPRCRCDFGYYWRDNCFVPYFYVAMALVSVLLCGALALMVRRRRAEQELQRELRAAAAERSSSVAGSWRIDWSQLRLRHVLARGGFGEVWLAELSDMLVVIKRLHSHCLEDAVSVQEFQREAEVMRTHRHPNIVLFLGAGTDPRGEPFLVMEHARRGSLKSLLADASVAISHNDRLRFMLDAAKGMAYLHGSQPAIVHRDLKCANLLVTERWVVKVADFGTARLMSFLGQPVGRREAAGDARERDPLLQSPEVTFNIGTAAYQSPEMIRCQAYGPSTDVYSYGLVMWASYCRKSPFYEDRYRFMHKLHNTVLGGDRPSIPDDMPCEYSDLMHECWQDNVLSRPEFHEIVNRLDFQLISW